MSTYVKLSTMEYPRHIGDIQIDPAGMADYALVEWVDPPQYNSSIEYLSNEPKKEGTTWKISWKVLPIANEVLATNIREKRNNLLRESDWTQVKDIPESVSTAWATYRQLLRDIPQQQGFPTDVSWPVKPQ